MNLYRETMSIFERDGYTIENVDFVSLDGIGIRPSEFWDYAKHLNYYEGYGTAEVPNFIIRMDDGSWYERREYDGSEWWNHVVIPERPEWFASMRAILGTGDYWEYPQAFEACGIVLMSDTPEELDYLDFIDELEARYA